MSYRVIYSPTFIRCISEQVDYLRVQRVSEDTIEDWFDRLFHTVDELNEWPRRCPVDEKATKQAGYEIRKLIFSRHYVINYHVSDASGSVEVLGMIHGARRK